MNTTLEEFNNKIKKRKKLISENKKREKARYDWRSKELDTFFKRLIYYLKPFDGQILEGNKIKLEINSKRYAIKFFINNKEYVQFNSWIRPSICDCQDYCDCVPRDVYEMYYVGENVGHTNINFSDEKTFSESIINLMDDYKENN